MTEAEEVDALWGIGCTKKKGWQQHDCPVLSADFGDLETAWKAARKSVDIETVKREIVAQARFRRDSRQRGDFVPQPKLFASWLRKKRWRDKIEPNPEAKERVSGKICKCGQETHGPKYDECDDCMGKENGKLKGWGAEMMRDNYVGQDINYSHLNRIHKPGNFSTVLKLIHLWNRTAHNAHVKTYNSNRYRKT